MLLALRLLLRLGRFIRTALRGAADGTDLRRKAARRRDGIGLVKDDSRGRTAGDGVPAHIPRLDVQTLGHVEEQDLAAHGDILHRLGLQGERLVEVGGARALVAAGAGKGEVVLVRELEATFVGPVEGPGVETLVADGEGPGARGLADEVDEVACVIGREVADVGVVGGFRVGRVVHGRLTRIGIHGAVGSCRPAAGEPWVYSEVGQRVKAVGSGDLGGVDFGF